MRLLRAACKRGVAGVVVTHDAQLASWADRVVFLRDGRVVDQTARPPGPESLLRVAARGARRERAAGGIAARRAVVRWAWRLFRREWRQQLLVLALLTVAVAAAVFSAAAAYNLVPSADARFGTADPSPRARRGRPGARLDADVAAVEAWFGTIEVIGHRAGAGPGLGRAVELRTQDPEGAFGSADAGAPVRAATRPPPARSRSPTGGGDLRGRASAARVALDGRARTVVGLVENPGDLDDEFALVAPAAPTRRRR